MQDRRLQNCKDQMKTYEQKNFKIQIKKNVYIIFSAHEANIKF